MKKLNCPNKYCLKNESDILNCSAKIGDECNKYTLLFTEDNVELGIKWLKGECLNDECQYRVKDKCNKPKSICPPPEHCLYKEFEG